MLGLYNDPNVLDNPTFPYHQHVTYLRLTSIDLQYIGDIYARHLSNEGIIFLIDHGVSLQLGLIGTLIERRSDPFPRESYSVLSSAHFIPHKNAQAILNSEFPRWIEYNVPLAVALAHNTSIQEMTELTSGMVEAILSEDFIGDPTKLPQLRELYYGIKHFQGGVEYRELLEQRLFA